MNNHVSDNLIEADSTREWLTEVFSRWQSKKSYYNSSHDKTSSGDKWTMFESYEKFHDIFFGKEKSSYIDEIINSNFENISQVTQLVNHDTGRSTIFKDEYATSGHYLDIGRYLEGEPESWMDSVRPVNELIDIYVSGSIHCTTTAKRTVEDAIQLSKLVYILKIKGYNARIFYVDNGTYGTLKFKIKDFRDELNVRELILIMLPDFYRRFVFQFFELNQDLTEEYGRGEGFQHFVNQFSENVLTMNLMNHDSLRISNYLLEKVGSERDVRTVVRMVNER